VSAGTLDAVIVPVAEAFSDVGELVTADGVGLLAELGYQLPGGGDPAALFSDFLAAVGRLAGALKTVADAYQAGTAADPSFLPKVIELGSAVAAVVSQAQKLGEKGAAVFAADPDFVARSGLDQLPQRLIDLSIVRHLRRRYPRAAATLDLLGLVSETFVAAGEFNPDFTLVEVHWSRFPKVVTDPGGLVTDAYGWGSAAFQDALLRDRLSALLWVYGIAAEIVVVPEADPGSGPPGSTELAVPLYTGAVETADAGAGVVISLRVRRSGDADDVGLAVAPRAEGAAELSLPLTEGWAIRFGAALAAEAFALVVRPSGVGVEAAAGLTGRASVALARDAAALGPLVLLGSAGATRLEIGDVGAELFATLDDGEADVGAEFALRGLALVITAGQGDGFLARVLPAGPLTVSADLTAGFSARRGVYVLGGAGLDFTFPVNAEIGPLLIDAVRLVLTVDGQRARLRVTVDGGLALGPFAASVQGIGVEATVDFGTGGSAGGADLTVGFRPPTGVGIAIDATMVAGGGFLALDYEAGRYSGLFELTLAESISVKAVAMINTRFPDGSPGFALLIMITAEGFTPIQLGMGFSLTGIGGLLALNRTVNADAVRGGLQDGVLDSILFVKDPVRNANRILATLDRVFPIAPDRLVVGPLAEISWGAPVPLVKLRVALLLEVPQPIRVILLAALALTLPRPEKPVVELHVDAIGVLDLGRGQLSLDASLHDSRLLKFVLTGDLALRLNWGDDPMFVLSAGGFHPRYPRPRGLPALRRIALTLTGGDNPRVRLETYFAVTSNSIQLGARVTLYAEYGGFGVDGGGAFDALVQWSPFLLDVAFAAWVRIFGPTGTLLAASLALQVTGPAPWHITGQVSVQILFFSVSVAVDLVVGEAVEAAPVDPVDVEKLLWEAVSDRANWQAVLPPGVRPGVTLASPAAGGTLLAHPLAAISVRQKVVPLGVPVSHVGPALPLGGTRAWTLDVAGPAGFVTARVDELFAPAQFTDVPDDARLGGPSFAAMAAGVSLSAASSSDAGPGIGCELGYETLDVTALDLPATAGDPVAADAMTAVPR
jgi:hypothetical protein